MDEVLIDTNVLVYAHQTEDLRKRTRAVEIIKQLGENGRGRLSAQILAEFVKVTTTGRRRALTIDVARVQIESLMRMFIIFDVTPFIVLEAASGVREHRLSYYDAQIWATAKLHQVATIFTEDFTDGRVVEGVRFVNPFLH
jgi:predicted nucleic acid-binding protein